MDLVIAANKWKIVILVRLNAKNRQFVKLCYIKLIYVRGLDQSALRHRCTK